MNYGASDQPLRKISLDIEEGADIVMVKPALPYLDIIRRSFESFDIPMSAYQASGDYAMIYLISYVTRKLSLGRYFRQWGDWWDASTFKSEVLDLSPETKGVLDDLDSDSNIFDYKTEEDLKEIGISDGPDAEKILNLNRLRVKVEDREPEEKLTYNDLLTSSRDYILEKLGEDIYNDLGFIRDWRNKVSHAHTEEIRADTALKVVERAEMIYKLLKNFIFSTM